MGGGKAPTWRKKINFNLKWRDLVISERYFLEIWGQFVLASRSWRNSSPQLSSVSYVPVGL